MYKVFVKDIPIILSTDKNCPPPYITIPLKAARFKSIVKKIFNGKKLYVHLYHKNEEKLEQFLRKKIKVVEAGGGLISNSKDEVLFIKRNGKWDLPKGKIEQGESPEEAAVREVMEETGIPEVEVENFLLKTYHVFLRNGKFRLKLTYWFHMKSDFNGEFVPQIDEGIKKVKWKNAEKTKIALKDSYSNIKLVFDKYNL